MNLNLRTQILIGIAAASVIALLGAAVLLLNQIGPGPAALLPAGRTLALVANIPAEAHDTLQRWMSWTSGIPFTGDTSPVAALIRNPDGSTDWISFDEHGQPQWDILGEGERSLADDPAYRSLASTYEPGSGWMFARFPDVAMTVHGINRPQMPMSFRVGTGSVQVAWIQASPSLPLLSSAPELIDDTTVLSVDAGNLAALMRGASKALPNSQRLAIESILRGWTTRLFGPEISAEYDMLPLADSQASLVLKSISGGSLATLLATTVSDDAEKSVDRLHRAVRSAAIKPERMQRTFNDSFKVDILMQRAPAVSSGSVQDGWTMHETVTQENGSGLFSAVKGDQVTLSTNNNLIQQFFNARRISAELGTVARGYLSIPATSALLSRMGLAIDLPQLFPGTSSINWQLSRKGDLFILKID